MATSSMRTIPSRCRKSTVTRSKRPLMNFKKTDVLCYVNGQDSPSWIPRRNVPMLFRNPFRFGKRVPWRPCGETSAVWSIDKQTNTLSVEGVALGTVRSAEPYNESIFGNALLTPEEGRDQLRTIWKRILTLLAGRTTAALSTEIMKAATVAFSFGLDEKCDPAEESYLSTNFFAYLRIVLGDSFPDYCATQTHDEYRGADGQAFGRPV